MGREDKVKPPVCHQLLFLSFEDVFPDSSAYLLPYGSALMSVIAETVGKCSFTRLPVLSPAAPERRHTCVPLLAGRPILLALFYPVCNILDPA